MTTQRFPLSVFARVCAVLVAALATFAGCGAGDENQGRQSLGEPGTCVPSGPGDCATCDDLLDTPCVCKASDGTVGPCAGEALDRCEADKQATYDACVRAERCTKTVLEPALAACPAKNAPGGEACIIKAYADYQACLGPSPSPNPGGTR